MRKPWKKARLGRKLAEEIYEQWSKGLVRLMVGRETLFQLDRTTGKTAEAVAIDRPILTIENLHVHDDPALTNLKGVSFELDRFDISFGKQRDSLMLR